jgi:hypothetical protein
MYCYKLVTKIQSYNFNGKIVLCARKTLLKNLPSSCFYELLIVLRKSFQLLYGCTVLLPNQFIK